MKTKSVLFGKEARASIKSGAKKIGDAVRVTLGAAGRTVIIGRKGNNILTRDGYTVVKNIYLEDEIERVGADILKQVAFKTVKEAGDSTTSATILAQSILDFGIDIIDAEGANINSVSLKRGIDMAVNFVIADIKSSAEQIDIKSGKLLSIATISANNDVEIGRHVAEAVQRTGKDGVVSIDESRTGKTYIEVVEGLQFERGYISPYLMNDWSNLSCQLANNPYVLVSEGKISSQKDILPILELVAKENQKTNTKRGFLLIAEDFDGEALHILITHVARSKDPFCAVKAPSVGENAKSMLRDIAIVVGATVANDESGLRLESLKLTHLGSAEKIMVTKDETTIVGGKGNRADIESQIQYIKTAIEQSKHEYETQQLESRLAKISGGIGIIYVGGNTDVEMNEMKDRIDDALRACKCAIQEGIVAGGGVALIRSSEKLKLLKGDTDDENAGIELIRKAMLSPFNQMALNAGVTVTVEDVLKGEGGYGYNFKTNKFENLIESGVIDPAKVITVALSNAASVSSTLLTSEALVVNVDDPMPSIPNMR